MEAQESNGDVERGSENVFDGTREKVNDVDDAILRRDGGLCQVEMAELDCIGEEGGLGLAIHEMITTVVVEGRVNVEGFARAKLPRLTVVWFGVDEDLAPERSDRSGVIIVGAMEVLPGGDVRRKGGLKKRVDRELSLRE